MTNISRTARTAVLGLVAGLTLCALYVVPGALTPAASAQGAPRYVFDPTWPKPLPNKWKMGGVTGLAVDRNDDVWVLNRPNDTLDIEGHAGLTPAIADCCRRPPALIHISKNGDTIGSFDAMQGHGMDVDSQGFVYVGSNTVRKYDPKTGQLVKELARVPEAQPGGGGRGVDPAEQAKRVAAFRAKYPPDTPMIVGGLEEIRMDEPVREMYVADNYLGGRILVFDMDTFAFKRGWGAYGKPLNQISLNDADHDYTPNGAMPKDFAGHLTFNFSNDGKVYAADRNANRIQVTDKQGKYLNQEFIVAPSTGQGGSTGGVAFSNDKEQRFLIISDLTNNKIWFLNRADGKVVSSVGQMGENGGQWFGLHMIAIDSQGNIYTGEVFNGERVQRYVPADSPRGKQLLAAGLQPMS
jgi:DNA-binding beta-propeller fold protein YncE